MKKITLFFALLFALVNLNGQVVLSENFDTALNWSVAHPIGTDTNVGWSQVATGVTGSSSATINPFAGVGMARFNSYNIDVVNSYELNSPSIALTGGSYRVTFKMFRDSGYGTTAADKIDVFVNTVAGSTGGTNIGTVNRAIGLSPIVTADGWYSYTFLIPGNPSGARFISFLATTDYGNNMFIDEVVIENVPSCAEPTALVSSAITTTSATISWTAPTVAPANGYDYYLNISNIAPLTTTIPTGSVAAGVTTKALTGLSQSTIYYFWVRSKCSSTTTSAWTSISFATVTPPPANDDCANAILLTAGVTINSNPLIGNTVSAATTAGLTFACQPLRNNDVWYKVAIPASGNLTLETSPSIGSPLIVDTVMSVFSSCGGTEIGCDDDSGTASNFSKIILTGQTPNSVIYVGVWRYNATVDGKFRISAYDASLSNSTFNNENFSYYPNPVVDILNLKYNENISSASVFNLLGQQVLSKSINQNETLLDLSSLPTGTYLVKLSVDNLVKTIKINKL